MFVLTQVEGLRTEGITFTIDMSQSTISLLTKAITENHQPQHIPANDDACSFYGPNKPLLHFISLIRI